MNRGQARPGLPRVSAFHPVQLRPCRRSSLNIRISRVARPGRLSESRSSDVQPPAIRVRGSAARSCRPGRGSWLPDDCGHLRPIRVTPGPGAMNLSEFNDSDRCGHLNVHCVYPDRPDPQPDGRACLTVRQDEGPP